MLSAGGEGAVAVKLRVGRRGFLAATAAAAGSRQSVVR